MRDARRVSSRAEDEKAHPMSRNMLWPAAAVLRAKRDGRPRCSGRTVALRPLPPRRTAPLSAAMGMKRVCESHVSQTIDTTDKADMIVAGVTEAEVQA
jgi:hypothetical protein